MTNSMSKILIFKDGPLLTNYRKWLLNKCNYKKKEYSRLMELLLRLPFENILERDEDRILDGYALRRRYLNELGIKTLEIHFEKPCSILELLIALSIRIDSEYTGDPKMPSPNIIFEEMINNLGLIIFNNKNFDENKIMNNIEKFVNRTYEPNGIGGIFPIKDGQRDERAIPIWEQMTAYTHQNIERLMN